MTRFIITADIHGNYNSWLTLKSLLRNDDSLVIAGDIFDTRYGSYADNDFKPESIKQELLDFPNDVYYVYGNCDTPSYLPEFRPDLEFYAFTKKIFLHHGHKPFHMDKPGKADIIIQGHTHIFRLEKNNHGIFMNPGSVTCPKNGICTYGIIEKNSAHIADLRTGEKLISINYEEL
jgi:putative phosphoesterase